MTEHAGTSMGDPRGWEEGGSRETGTGGVVSPGREEEGREKEVVSSDYSEQLVLRWTEFHFLHRGN